MTVLEPLYHQCLGGGALICNFRGWWPEKARFSFMFKKASSANISSSTRLEGNEDYSGTFVNEATLLWWGGNKY